MVKVCPAGAGIIGEIGQDLGYGGHEAVVIVEDYVIVIGHNP